jgi:lipoprotein NlpD
VLDQQPVAVTRTPGLKSVDGAAAKSNRRRGDERPDAYVVQRGDTLYAIALDFGFDYRELAAWNELADPSRILVGQRLRFTPPQKDVAPEVKALPAAAVVAAEPLGQAGVPGPPPVADVVQPGKVPVLSEPRATTVPYTESALAKAVPSAAPATARPAQAPAVPVATPPVSVPNDRQSPEEDEALDWAWPVRGDILYRFGDTGRLKGIGIGGRMGQPVSAAATGKVVYSGTGLRGYGRLVIVKHNETYLSVYAHNSVLAVKEGDAVKRGQRIADMGDTDTSRVSLHFEVRRFGKPIDPLVRLPAP